MTRIVKINANMAIFEPFLGDEYKVKSRELTFFDETHFNFNDGSIRMYSDRNKTIFHVVKSGKIYKAYTNIGQLFTVCYDAGWQRREGEFKHILGIL